ncbi:hypothetical protein [Rhodopirellula baltica]|uniref:Uncharacterized protein n=1 Tax=Rhodopirellula baltica SWK14 TaxID=993516 RepID=L7CGD7_RHOBT|nr:hypothetical protein [Rhodopirellula baltica]ELP32915.1 hypothetical protein RBSWK_03162 [Rhodopirellula baltica SWK14]
MSSLFPIRTKEFSQLKFVRSQESSVTTAWGVDWSDAMIARDLLQNFYDAHLNSVQDISITVNGSSATVAGKIGFDLNKLFYLASEKTEKHVGQYGEGFKAAIACLLRRHPDAVVVARSGNAAVSVRLEDRELGHSTVQPLVYDFYESPVEYSGSELAIRKVTTDLTSEISTAISQFWHSENPLSGEILCRSSDGKLSVYRSTDEKGHLFYRGLKRGEMVGLPLVLVCDKPYRQIERKTAQDRDRKAFDDAVLGTLYSVWANNFFKHDSSAIGVVLDAAKPLWQDGKSHTLVSAIASKHPRVGTLISDRFKGDYFAVCKASDPMKQLRITAKEDEWRADGRVALPANFSTFGVENAESFFVEQLKRAEKKAERNGRRVLSPAETAAKEVLEHAVQEFAPEIWESFGNRRPNYSVAETEALLGQFKKALPYRTSQVFLAASVFEADFATAISVFLHEHTHIYGYDGGREFTDALTWLLAAVIRNRKGIDQFERDWRTAARKVAAERKANTNRSDQEVETTITALSESEMRQLLGMLPPSQVELLAGQLQRE